MFPPAAGIVACFVHCYIFTHYIMIYMQQGMLYLCPLKSHPADVDKEMSRNS